MDLDSLQEDLNALRKLYGLVQMSESGVNTAISETLDEGSRVFLRKLLDAAAEKVFQTHVKIMADNWRSVLGPKHLGQVEEAEEIQRSEPSISSYAAKSNDFYQSIKESVGALLLKDDTLDQACDSSILDQGLDTEQSLEPVKDFGVLGDTRTSKINCISSDKESIACSTSNVTPRNEVKGKAPNVEDFSKEVDDAIRRIESLIPSLHRLAKPVRTPTSKKLGNSDSFTKTTSVLDLDVVTESKESQTRQAYQEIGNCNKFSPRLEQMYDYESLKEGQAHLIPKTHQPVHNTACEWDDMKGDEFSEKSMGRIQGEFEGKQIQRTSKKSHQLVRNTTRERDGTSKGNEFLEGPIGRILGEMDTRYENVSQNDNVGKSCYQKEVRRKTPTSRSSISPPSRGRVVMRNSVHRGNQVQLRGSVLENHLPSRRKSMSRENSHWSSKDNSPARYNESDESYTDSPGSSSWTTVDASSSYSPSTTILTSSSYSVENEDSRFSGSSPNSQDDDFESSGTPYITNQSSFSEGDLSPSEYYQSSHHTVRNQGKGGFRRLKNKLGLIFHHHHHHHHHHHKKSDQASGSVWNQFGKMFRHTEKAEAKNPKKADSSRKEKHLAKSGSRKKQIGHFHALVEGLMKHVRHSKKAKKAKGSFGKHVRHLGENKDGKKPNWLQNLGGQRGKVKVHHKTRAKLQGRDNKPQLTVPKSHSRHS